MELIKTLALMVVACTFLIETAYTVKVLNKIEDILDKHSDLIESHEDRIGRLEG